MFRYTSFIITLIFSALLITGCASTYETSKGKEKGFIEEDYLELTEDAEGNLSLLYINEEADFKQYDKIWIETVTAYVYEGSSLEKANQGDVDKLVQYFEEALERELAKDYEIVEAAGEGTLKLRVALTEISGSKRLLNTVSTVAPPARAFSELKRFVTGTHSFVGKAAFEAEALDSITGVTLAAKVGSRGGGKRLRSAQDKYRDVKAAIDFWAKNFREKLNQLRTQEAATILYY